MFKKRVNISNSSIHQVQVADIINNINHVTPHMPEISFHISRFTMIMSDYSQCIYQATAELDIFMAQTQEVAQHFEIHQDKAYVRMIVYEQLIPSMCTIFKQVTDESFLVNQEIQAGLNNLEVNIGEALSFAQRFPEMAVERLSFINGLECSIPFVDQFITKVQELKVIIANVNIPGDTSVKEQNRLLLIECETLIHNFTLYKRILYRLLRIYQ